MLLPLRTPIRCVRIRSERYRLEPPANPAICAVPRKAEVIGTLADRDRPLWVDAAAVEMIPATRLCVHAQLRRLDYADLRTALSTNVLPSDQIAPGTLWLEAITESNAVSIQLQSSSVMVKGGNSLMVWLPWPETWVRIL
jgi:hypothetical protein